MVNSVGLINFFQVEEIEDVDVNSVDPLLAIALANEDELDLSEEQKKNFKKVNYLDVLI